MLYRPGNIIFNGFNYSVFEISGLISDTLDNSGNDCFADPDGFLSNLRHVLVNGLMQNLQEIENNLACTIGKLDGILSESLNEAEYCIYTSSNNAVRIIGHTSDELSNDTGCS